MKPRTPIPIAILPPEVGFDPRIPHAALRLLIVLHELGAFREHVPVSGSELAHSMHLHKSTIYRALRRLVALGYLDVRDEGRRATYQAKYPERRTA